MTHRSIRVLTLTLLCASGLALLAPQMTPAATRTAGYVVVLKRGGAPAQVARAHRVSASRLYTSAIRGFAATLTTDQVRALRGDSQVDFVAPDRVLSIGRNAAKPGGSTPVPQTVPTGVRRIDGLSSASAAIDGVDTRVNVDVAVIDTGIASSNADLAVSGGVNCSAGSSWNDGNGHGTHVAGTIAAIDNARDVVGVAPGSRLWAVRVLNNAGSGTTSSVICGIDWVTAHAATIEVANMSLGGPGGDDGDCGNTNADPMHQAICRSVAAGVTYVVAAGNDGADSAASVPASYDEVITVSALADFDGLPGGLASATCRSDVDDTFADFSNFGTDVDIAAPGVCITSTWKDGSLKTISGTSMATPHVTGAAALYRAAFPAATPQDVRAALVAAATPGPIAGDPDSSAEPVLSVATL